MCSRPRPVRLPFKNGLRRLNTETIVDRLHSKPKLATILQPSPKPFRINGGERGIRTIASRDITLTYGLLVAIAASLATVAKAGRYWPRGSWPPDGHPALRFPSAHPECPGASFSSQAVLWPRYRKHYSERAQRSNAYEHYRFEAIENRYR